MVKTILQSAALSHPGQKRDNNEDLCFRDDAAGIYIVVDGVGGYAAGEQAAQIAVERLTARLTTPIGSIEERVREAITNANNEIYRQGEANPNWQGMACVLTLAVIADDHVYWGHVGDTRLYKLHAGKLRKLTHDHSPIGEREDAGLLPELEAMTHPRRNEIFRDVGSQLHTPDDEEFIEYGSEPFEPDASLLLCSDGLTDMISQAHIQRIIEEGAGAPDTIAQKLIEAANEAGGNDNVTVVYVEGEVPKAHAKEEITGRRLALAQMPSAAEAVESVPSPDRSLLPDWMTGRLMTLMLGILLGALLMGLVQWWRGRQVIPVQIAPRMIVVNQEGKGDARSITEAMQQAQPGDTVLLDPGEYPEVIQMKEGVTVESRQSQQAILMVQTQEAAVRAENIQGARLIGLRIVGNDLKTGVLIRNANVEVVHLDISGVSEAGVLINGTATVTACRIHDNAGSGIRVIGEGAPTLTRNWLLRNRGIGVEVLLPSHPTMKENVFADNQQDSNYALTEVEQQQNFFAVQPKKLGIQ
jgi:PPM family protein phosphatase